MNQRVMRLFLITLFISLSCSKSLPAAGKPDITRHEANFLESAVNLHIEWQSPNPVVSVKITMVNQQKEIKVDPYDNKRNRDGYAGEVNVTLGLDWVPGQPFTYIIQLEDELRIKSPPVTGKVKISSSQQPGMAIQPQQPGMQIQIQQNITQPGGLAGIQPYPQPGVQPGIQPGSLPGAQPGMQPTPVPGQGGVLIVIISPEFIAQTGAMWRVDAGQWMKSGETLSNLPTGIHTIEYSGINDWIKPDNQKAMIEDGKIITVDGVYSFK